MTADDSSKAIAKANRLLKRRKLRNAIEVLERAVHVNPQSVECLIFLGVLHSNNGNYKEAERAYRSAESLSPENPKLNWQLSELLLSLNRPEGALPYLEFSIREWPTNSQTHALIGKAFLQLKRYDEAEAALKKALGLDDSNPDARDLTVDLYLETEREGLIEGLLNEYLANEPKLASSHVFMADYLNILEGDCLGSLPFYEAGLRLAGDRKLAPWYSRFFSTVGYPQSIAYKYLNALMDCGYQDLAKDVARENLSGTDALTWKANVARINNDLGTAIQIMKEAVAKEPQKHDWKYTLGWYFLLDGKPKLAETQFREILKSGDEESVEIRYLAAMYIILAEQDNLNDAKQLKQGALAKDSGSFWLSLAAHFADLENWKKALEATQYALEAKPDFKAALQYKAQALVNLKDMQKGIDTFRRIIELQPRNGKAYIELSKAYYMVGDKKQAISTIENALTLSLLSEPQKKEVKRMRANH
jgi:tetratricopeptide (TPR) repeat protein